MNTYKPLFASSTNPQSIAITVQGILITLATQLAPFAVTALVKVGVPLTTEQAVSLLVTLSIFFYGLLRKVLVKYAVVLPEVPAQVDAPTVQA
jgi:hypothetical protein